jgi:methyl-accepting chemotaxis protein
LVQQSAAAAANLKRQARHLVQAVSAFKLQGA